MNSIAPKPGPTRGQARVTAPLPRWIPPQLCQLVDVPPTGPQWREISRHRRRSRQAAGDCGLSRRRVARHRRRQLAELCANAGGERRLARHAPGLYVFDLLYLDGRNTAGLPLIERKELLNSSRARPAFSTMTTSPATAS